MYGKNRVSLRFQATSGWRWFDRAQHSALCMGIE